MRSKVEEESEEVKNVLFPGKIFVTCEVCGAREVRVPGKIRGPGEVCGTGPGPGGVEDLEYKMKFRLNL